jgi:hypothetical protein
MNAKLKKLQSEAPLEIPKFLEASKLMKQMDGFSISSDDATLNKIKQTLSFVPSTNEGKELKRNILSTATKKSREGMMGDGVFILD